MNDKTINDEMKVIREVSIQAENCYDDAVKLGYYASLALKATHRSQMTGLENVAESTFKTSDVFDYIKRQTARLSYWRQTFPDLKNTNKTEPNKVEISFGEQLRNYLENDLKSRLEMIYRHLKIENITDEDKQERRRIHLLLMRQFIRQMVVNYEYTVSLGNNRKRES